VFYGYHHQNAIPLYYLYKKLFFSIELGYVRYPRIFAGITPFTSPLGLGKSTRINHYRGLKSILDRRINQTQGETRGRPGTGVWETITDEEEF
jgi:hypothetical protein